MPEVKNTFLKSKMNKDLDARILPNGEYRDAQNINVSKSEGEDVGSLENVLSNIQISDIKNDIIQAELNYANNNPKILYPPTSSQIENSLLGLEVIGEFVDIKNNRIFLALTNYTDTSADRLSNFAYGDIYESLTTPLKGLSFQGKGAGCYIYMLDLNSNINSVLVGGSFLNFSKTHKILGINILEDLLFWTDDRNQPRKINVNRASNKSFSSGDPYYFNEDHVSVAKFAPVFPISLIEEVSANNWSSTMQSVTEEYLPIHLIDSIANNKDGTEELVVLKRSFPAGTSSSLIQEGDKVIIENDDGEEFEYNIKVGGLSGGSFENEFEIEGTFEDGGLTNGIVAGWVVKLQRPNPVFDPEYIGDRNVLKDKFYRFSYRFKYDDNEYSLFAPFTQEVFVPKQYGYFLDRDESETGKSGIVSFMENLIDKVKFNIRLPHLGTDMENSLKIKEIQIVSKTSDEQALKVIEDVPVGDLTNTQDYIYEYNSIKPYKTLPEKEITRVHDKIPIRAKCQEVTSNRVLYGNYVNKHTSPDFLNYQLKINRKNTPDPGDTFDPTTGLPTTVFNQLRKEYPNNTLKQNRSYTVAVVLMDRYGRPSNVILSKQEVVGVGDDVSTIYAPYTNAGADRISAWPGNVLEIQFNEIVQDAGPEGYPGLYSETNPLGWYSYKIVVKQQEQEYYNVYLPGILGGEIIWSTKPLKLNEAKDDYEVVAGETAINQPQYINSTQTSLISLFGDNINKIPRNLNEVGATDIDFGSSVELFNRVNPNSWDSAITSTVGPVNYSKGIPYNTQSRVDNTPDTVDFIKPFKQLGDWTTTKGNAYPEQNNVLGVKPFADPWYPFTGGIDAGGGAEDIIFKDPLYKSNENPFIASVSTQFKTGVNPKQLQSAGNYYYANTGENRLGDTTLGVYETNPVESFLELFWETSTSGLIENDSYISDSNQYQSLNDLVYQEAGANGPWLISEYNFDFKESDPVNSLITDTFEILQQDGNPCNDNSNVITIVSVKDGNLNDRINDFEIVQNPLMGGLTTWAIRNKRIIPYLSDANTKEKYVIKLELTANGQTKTLGITGFLSNITPSVLVPVTNNYDSVIYYEWKVTEGLTIETKSDDEVNIIPINCSNIALQSTNGNPITIQLEKQLYNEFAIVNGVSNGINNPDSIRQIKHECDLIDINNGRDYNNVLEVEVVPSGNGSKFRLKAKSNLSRNDFPSPSTVSTDPTFLATFRITSTDANGGGLSTSETFRCLMFGPEFQRPGVLFQQNISYRNSMKP